MLKLQKVSKYYGNDCKNLFIFNGCYIIFIDRIFYYLVIYKCINTAVILVLFMLLFFGQEIEHHCHTSCGSLIVIGITFFIIKAYRWTEGVCLKRYFNKIWMRQIICYFYYHLQDAILYLTLKNLIENTNWKKQKGKEAFLKIGALKIYEKRFHFST